MLRWWRRGFVAKDKSNLKGDGQECPSHTLHIYTLHILKFLWHSK